MPVGFGELQEKIEVVVADIAVHEHLALPIDNAHVHLPRVQINSAVEFRRRCVILHPSLLTLRCQLEASSRGKPVCLASKEALPHQRIYIMNRPQ